MPRVLYHLHSNHSDGELTIPDIWQVAIQSNVDAIVLLDHARIDGCVELKKLAQKYSNKVKIPISYEHTVGNTDLGLIGVTSVFPSQLTVEQVCKSVKKQGGATIYLHPFRHNERHIAELKRLHSLGLLDGFENYNSRDGLINKLGDRLEFTQIWGLDAHEKHEYQNIPSQAMHWDENDPIWQTIIAANKHTLDIRKIKTDFQLIAPKKLELETSVADIIVKANPRIINVNINCFSCWPIHYKGDTPWDADCFEIAVTNGLRDSMLYTFHMTTTNSPYISCFKLSETGISQCNEKNSFITIEASFHKINIEIVSKNFLFDYIALALNHRAKYPADERLIWPKPVWPPRTIFDYYRV
ncbi:MAG: PHP domain-containing protein [Desulfococcaceae bacterium]